MEKDLEVTGSDKQVVTKMVTESDLRESKDGELKSGEKSDGEPNKQDGVDKQDSKKPREQEAPKHAVEKQEVISDIEHGDGEQNVEEQPQETTYRSSLEKYEYQFYKLDHIPEQIEDMTVEEGELIPLTIDFEAYALTVGTSRIPFNKFRYSCVLGLNKHKKQVMVVSFSSVASIHFLFLGEVQTGTAMQCEGILHLVLLMKYQSITPAQPAEAHQNMISESRPTFYGVLNVSIADLDEIVTFSSVRFCILDKECVFLAKNDKNVQPIVVYFWRKGGTNVLELAKFDRKEGAIHLETDSNRYTIFDEVS